MDPKLAAVASCHHGLIPRQAAVRAGVTARRIDAALRSGEIVAVRRSVYADRGWWEDLGPDDRERMAGIAVSLTMRTEHVLSHDSAALIHGLPLVGRTSTRVHVTRDRPRGGHTEWGVTHHAAPFGPGEVEEIDGIRLLGVPRTVLDLAREHGVTTGLVAADAALHAGLDPASLADTASRMWCWPGTRHMESVVALADGRAESPGETLMRQMVIEAGLGPVDGRFDLQFELRDDLRWVRADLRVGRHLFEFDGKLKYPGTPVARRDPRETAWEEKRRQDWLHGHRLGVSRVVWAECWGPARVARIRGLREEFAETCRRYGSSIEDLAPLMVRRTA